MKVNLPAGPAPVNGRCWGARENTGAQTLTAKGRGTIL